MPAATRPRAAAYARSSDDKQEASCPQQRKWAVGKAAALGLELVACHEDEGIAGDRLDRPGLEALFDDLTRHQKAKRPLTTLLLFDQDRLSRATSWATGAIMERLMRLGVERLVMATEEVDLYDDGARAMFGVKQDLSKRAYAKQVSKNVSRGMALLAAAGCWTGGSAPYGYRIAGEARNRRLVPGPAEEVAALRELFRLAAEGVLGIWGLARLANERGWPVPSASAKRQKGRAPQWTGYTVGWLLRQPVYLGVIRYGQRRKGKYHQAAESGPVERRGLSQDAAPALVREGCHEPLIDRDTFERVRAVLVSRRPGVVVKTDPESVARRERRRKRLRAARAEGRLPQTRRPERFLFRGKLTCATCGAVMQGRHRDDFEGYVCSTWRNRRGCSRNSVHEGELLDRVAELLVHELGTKATIRELRQRLEAQRTGRGETLRLAIDRGRAHVAELARDVSAGGRRLLRISADLVPVVEKELQRLTQELETARADLAELDRQAATAQAEDSGIDELLDRLSQLPKLLKDADDDTRRRVVQLAVANVSLRFDVTVGPSGRKQSKWTGATVTLRGNGPVYEMTVPGSEACRAACPRCW
jgi:DNA invertase Pin-like site-specific DNA recombinase